MRKNYIFKSVLIMLTVLFGGAFTQVSAQYCVSAANSTFDTEIDEVTVTGSSMNISNNSAGVCATYTDNTTDTADAVLGTTINMTVTTGTCGGYFYGRMFKVYVDWNSDQDFDDPGEEVFASAYVSGNSQPPAISVPISVPSTAVPGYTRIRVVVRETSSASNIGPCSSSTSSNYYGETEDYTLQIKGYTNDIGIVALTNPTFPTCAIDSVVKVSIVNVGTAGLASATINWSVNGNIQPSYAYAPSTALASFAMDTLTMGTVAGGFNDGDVLVVWASMANGISPDSNTFNDTLSTVLYTSLSGTYTIGATGADFISFADALSAMDNFGICGPTVFEAIDSSYVEQMELKTYVGMSSVNTVTFQSQSGDPDAVTLSFSSASSSDNFVVKMYDADYFNFKNMSIKNIGTSYSHVIDMWGADSISFDNCKIISSGTNYNAYTMRLYYYNSGLYAGCHNFTLTNSEVIGGYYGMYFYQYNDPAQNAVIENNKFLDQYYRGVYLYYLNDVQFNNNYLTSSSTYTSAYGFYLGNVANGSVSNNFIEGTSSWPRYGFYLYNCSGDLTTFMPITNNRISMPNSNASYGLYVSGSLFAELAHNSVYMDGYSSTRGLYLTSGGYNKVKNNLVKVTGSGATAVYLNGSAVYQMDYNNYCSENGNLGYFSGNQATLADWQLATGFDSNSYNVCDVYSDSSILKVCTDSLYGKGVYLPMYAADFEGDMRQDPPCIGADEFQPISLFGFNDNPVLCNGDTLEIRQDYYDTVVWNGNDTTNVIYVNSPGQVTVQVIDGCGTAADTFNVDPQQMPTLDNPNLCEGTADTIGTGIPNGIYTWSTGSTDSVIVVNSAQTVTVTITDAYGCMSYDTAIVTQSYDVALNDLDSFCQGSNVVLDAAITGTYLWSDGSSNQTLSVSAAGTYSVTVVDQNCTSTDAVTVYEILNAVPSFTDSSDHFTVVFTNTSQNANSYLWDFGDGTTSTQENPIHIYPWSTNDVDTYTATLTAYNFCGDNEFINDGVRAGNIVSVSEIELASMVSVYPNPNNGVFNVVVKTDEAAELSVQVLDARGALIYTNSFGTINGEVNRTIDLEDAAQGIYFVKVTLDGETAVYRLSVN